MPAIVAPSPRLPLQHAALLSTQDPLVRQVPSNHARAFLSPTRLLSPIRLHDPPYIALNSKSPTPCGPPHKRRTVRLARRRRTQRIDCPLDAFGRASIFDQLPWISALESPAPINCDVADLSQLPLNEDPIAFSDAMPASGPVRRRKTSLRSNPLGSATPPSKPLLRQHPPIHRRTDPFLDSPRTPSPRVPFDPSRVTFHNLMPVFPHGAPS